MRTPEQIAEDMRREIDRERQLHGTMYNEGSAVLGAVARAIARECARAKLEAVEPNPGAELRSDGARHSDCTNCGGQSATGGVFPPCEACGSTGDRVAQLERGIVSAACAWADEPASDAVDCCTAKERAAGNALFDAVTEWRAKVKALTGLATRLDRVAGAVKAAQAQSFMMGDSPDAATDPGFCFNCGGTRAQCKCESPAFGLMTAAETQRLARHVEDRKAAMGPALDVRPRMNEACSECGAAIEDMGRPEYCEASGSIDPHADKVLHNWVARCLVRKAGHR